MTSLQCLALLWILLYSLSNNFAQKHTPKPVDVSVVPQDQQGLGLVQDAAQAHNSFGFVLDVHLGRFHNGLLIDSSAMLLSRLYGPL